MEMPSQHTKTDPSPPSTFNSEDHEIFAVAIADALNEEDVAIMIRYTDWTRFRHFKASDVAATIRRGQTMPLKQIDKQRLKRHLNLLHEAYLEAEKDQRLFADENVLTRKACNYILCGYLRTNATTAEIAEVVNREKLMPKPLDKLERHMVEKIYDFLAAECPKKIEEWKLMSVEDPEAKRIVEKLRAVVFQAEFLLEPREDR
ncbi:MAG: hypothetical protein Q9168_001848 [Polycauliona sp. 1 TL-2023]